MGANAEISWTRRTEEGEKLLVYAQHIGNQWKFFHRPKRFENWQEVETPPLEDWLELLDAVERRAQRRLAKPEELIRLRKTFRELFPDAVLD